MVDLKSLFKSHLIGVVLFIICLFPNRSHSAWPIFSFPALEEPKASICYAYWPDFSLSGYFTYEYDERGNLIKKIEFDTSGADGVWFTDDDVVEYDLDSRFYAYDMLNRKIREIEYLDEGPDGLPLTKDDPMVIDEYRIWLYDSNGDNYRTVEYDSPGSDGIWFTDDDEVDYYVDKHYDYANFIIREIEYDDPGSDGIWFNGDDVIDEYEINYHHSNFMPKSGVEYDGAGPDGKWFTSDDVKSEDYQVFYDENWNLIKLEETEVNVQFDELILHYDANGNCTRFISKEDGEIEYYLDYVYDTQDRRIEAYSYWQPGDDGKWFTGDDSWVIKAVYEYSSTPRDDDQDGLPTVLENTICTDADDADSDDDGIIDGVEDANQNGIVDAGETNPCRVDTDGDGLQDGTERGLTFVDVGADTDKAVFVSDADPETTTDPTLADTDGDGVADGSEDKNQNGRLDAGERNPADRDNQAMPWIPLLLDE